MNKQLLKTLLIVSILVVSLTTCKKPEPETTGIIQGIVKTSQGQPIEGALIKINSSTNALTTSIDGKFEFKDLQPKEYIILASKDGYAPNTQTVTAIAGETKIYDFVLAQANLTITPLTYSAPSTSGKTNLTIQSNISWTAISSEPTWLTCTQSGNGTGAIEVNYLANTTATTRTGTITVTATNSGLAPQIITITQASPSPSLTVTPTTQTVNSTQGSLTFTITSNVNWTANSDQNWCIIQNPSGNGNATLTVNYSTNNLQTLRTANITISGTGVASQIITLTQTGLQLTLSVSPSNQDVLNSASSVNFSVSSNTSWSATSDQTWCTLTNASGSGNGTITANYQANTSINNRTAQITITGTGVNPQTVTVTQASAQQYNLSVTPSNQDVDYKAGTKTFNISSNTSWTASSNQTWCTIQNPNGSNSATLNVNFTENKTATIRTATITISGTNVSPQSVTVTQTETTLYNGLVAYYPFNNNTATDESGNGNNGTNNGATATTDRKGNTNSAFSFDGINDYINVPNNSNQSNFSSATFSFWIYKTQYNPQTVEGLEGIITKWFQDINNDCYSIQTYGNQISINTYQYGLLTNALLANFSLNTWLNIVFVRNAGTDKIFINNQLITSKTVTGNLPVSTKPIIIGASNGGGTILRYFKGLIDDVRIYNRALTDSEIQQLYNE